MTADATTPLAYYATHSPFTDPGEHVALFDGLSGDILALCQLTQHVLIHRWKAQRDGSALTAEHRRELETRPIRRLLTRLRQVDDRPLSEPRHRDRQFVVDCRHFATLLCAMLRQQGRSARVRSGFATYLEATHYQMHVVTEYWAPEEGRWVLVDADLLRDDMPREEFFLSGAAWELCRTGVVEADRFGYGPEWRGLWAVGVEVVRDFAMLNKREVLCTDRWGLIADITDGAWADGTPAADADLLDRVAALHRADATASGLVQALYEAEERLRVPPVIRCVPNTGDPAYAVDLAEDLEFGVSA